MCIMHKNIAFQSRRLKNALNFYEWQYIYIYIYINTYIYIYTYVCHIFRIRNTSIPTWACQPRLIGQTGHIYRYRLYMGCNGGYMGSIEKQHGGASHPSPGNTQQPGPYGPGPWARASPGPM